MAKHHSPRFLQNITIDRLQSPTKKIDVVALDLIRDREHGVPRFNEFRRQYGLRQLTSFDDFIDHRLESSGGKSATAELARQRAYVVKLRAIYGQHRCDATKVITESQRNEDGSGIATYKVDRPYHFKMRVGDHRARVESFNVTLRNDLGQPFADTYELEAVAVFPAK